MRHLAQPWVLKSATLAALATALACYPRLTLWPNRLYAIWYLEAIIFFCSIVLWGFVFAWHEPYSRRPVFTLRIEPRWFVAATVAGLVVAAIHYLALDPMLQNRIPDEFPVGWRHWLARTLFSLAFSQLFLVFAPYDWLLRLLRRPGIALGLTAFFGAAVMAMKIHSTTALISPPLLAALLTGRMVAAFLAVIFYLRGGVLLSWWWTLLIDSRHLLELADGW